LMNPAIVIRAIIVPAKLTSQN